ncbi:MAG: hypothetical protein PHP00_01605 [Thiotrichaceae bacterium]|nr:hypothetical protein [Thiotrichaceae bacterium]
MSIFYTRTLLARTALSISLLMLVSTAHAVPSFSRQTGQDCAACHIGAFAQLTPFGIKFKLGGHVDSNGKKGNIPLSGMVVASFSKTAKNQDPAPSGGSANNNLKIDEASLFVAGRLNEKMGAFVQTTYDAIGKQLSLDNMDLRFVHSTELAGKEALFGISVNNNPSVQNPFNTLSAWGVPFSSSAFGFGTGGASTLMSDGLGSAHRVVGLSAYGFLDNSIYAELGTYRSLTPTMQSRLGQAHDGDMGRFGNNTAYWRLAYFKDLKKHAFSAGLFGFNTSVQPDWNTSQPTNTYRDIGIDASYQFLGTRKHIGTIQASYIRERQSRGSLVANGNADNLTGKLNEFKLSASYFYNQTWGFTASRFVTQGDSDATLYSVANGYANNSPNTAGYILQADWTPWGKEASWNAPWANVRLGLQYWLYGKYNGASQNYDGNGRDAKDNNTVFLFAWTAF